MKQSNRQHRPKNQPYRPRLSHPSQVSSPDIYKEHKKLSILALLLIIAVLGAGVYINIGHWGFPKYIRNKISSTVHEVTSTKIEPMSLATAQGLTLMSQTINGVIDNNPGVDVSVSIIDLGNNQTEHFGANQTFQAASTSKILTAEYFLHEVEDGKQSLSEMLNNYSAQYELKRMILLSDDNAGASLNKLLGNSNLQAYVGNTLNINDYQASSNSLSSGDIAETLQQLWEDKLLNKADTGLLLSYLAQASSRQYIVPAVPSADTIYHMAGTQEDYVNDAAIITHGNQAFILVIFTNGNGKYNWSARATMMQDITKASLEAYFNQN